MSVNQAPTPKILNSPDPSINKEFINAVELRSFANTKLAEVVLDVKTEKERNLTLFQLVGFGLYNFESIILLVQEKKAKTGEIILRTLFETVMYANYVVLENNDSNAIKFLLKDEYNRRTFVNELKTFFKQNPEYSNPFPELDTEEKMEKFVQEMDQAIAEMELKNNITEPMHGMNSVIDEIDRKIGKPDARFYHLTIYRHLSDLPHSNARGLNHLTTEIDGKIIITVGEDLKGAKELLSSSSILFLHLLSLLNENLGIFAPSELETFSKKLGT